MQLAAEVQTAALQGNKHIQVTQATMPVLEKASHVEADMVNKTYSLCKWMAVSACKSLQDVRIKECSRSAKSSL